MSQIDFTRATITFAQDTEYLKNDYATASWWTRHIIPAGTYDLELVNLGGSPWVEGKVTPGFIADIGPYYARVAIETTEVESYFVNRLFTASSVDHKTDTAVASTTHLSLYAYEVKDGMTRWGGVIRTYAEVTA